MSEEANSIFQWAGVVILIGFAVVYILGWFRGKKSACDSCGLKDNCSKRNKKSSESNNRKP